MTTKCYFAHSIHDYNTNNIDNHIENIWLESIRKYLESKYGGEYEIINPKDVNTEGTETVFDKMKVFFDLIDTCDLVIYAKDSNTNKITRFVQKEIKYAKDKGIKVKDVEKIKR